MARQKLVKSITDLPIRRALKFMICEHLVRLMPNRAKDICERAFDPRWTPLDRLLLRGLYARTLRTGNQVELQRLLKNYWRGCEGSEFHQRKAHRFESAFLKHHAHIVDEIETILKKNPGTFNQLCEIGCGNGKVLQYLADRFQALDKFVGLDLSEEQIAENRETYRSAGFEFYAGDAGQWITDHGQPSTIYFTYGGVLEYFAQPAIESLFAKVAQDSPTIFALVETIADDHDVDTQLESVVYGWELAFSHNYRHRLAGAGFRIRFEEEYRTDKDRWLLIVASSGVDETDSGENSHEA